MTSAAPTLLGLSWTALVAVAAWSRRPRAVRRLPPLAGVIEADRGPAARVGRALRSVLGMAPDAESDRLVGWSVVIGIALLAVAAPLAPLPVVAALLATRTVERRRERRADEAWSTALPDAVDLFALALGSGLTVPAALPIVAPRSPRPLGPALVEVDARFRHGEPLAAALARLTDAGPTARPLVSILVASHCEGLPVGEPLARLAADLRADRRQRAEARARQTPVRLLFPLVLCTLPAFVLVTVVPPVITALGGLTG